MIRTLAFVQLTVADWPRALAWYRDILGLEVVMSVAADRFALLRSGPSQVALKEGTPQPGSVQLTFETVDLETTVNTLLAKGATLVSPLRMSPEGYRRVLVRDPEGYLLCLFEWLTTEK